MSSRSKFFSSKLIALSGAAVVALGLYASGTALAQSHSSGGGGHETGSSHDGGSHDSSDHSAGSGHSGGQGGKQMRKGRNASGQGSSRGSLRDVFREMEDEAASSSDHGSGKDNASKGKKVQAGKSGDKGKQGGKPSGTADTKEVAEDSDRPEWAGTPGKEGKPGRPNTASGTKKGDLFGDTYALLRDENGVPIMIQLPDGTWAVQPVDADGNIIPLDEEGHPVDETLTVAVELGRFNVGRSPLQVLSARFEEVLKVLNDADTVELDPSGRITYTTDGEVKTLDSPLENLAIYVELMNTGTLTGVTDTSKFTGDLATLVDGTMTVDDLASAAAFFAAASDKTGNITEDAVVYMNSILGIEGTLTDAGEIGSYVDFTSFNYDRESVFGDATAEVLVLTDGVWVPTTVNLYDAVFSSAEYTSTDGGIDGFAQAADDARAVIEFVHEYSVPETPATN